MADRLPNQRDSGILDRIRALRGGIGTTARQQDYFFGPPRPPELAVTSPGQLRGPVEQMFPFPTFGQNLDTSLALTREGAPSVPMLDVSAGRTPASQLLRGIANVPGFVANRLIDETGTFIAAPLHAAATTAFSPTYQTYLDETVMPIAEGLFAEQQAAKARADKSTFMRREEDRLRRGLGSGVAGGPTYQQMPTPEDETAMLLAQQAAVQNMASGDPYSVAGKQMPVSFTGDVGPGGEFVAGNIFEPQPGDDTLVERLLAEGSANADEAAAAQARANAGAMEQDITAGAERGTDMTGDGSGTTTETTTETTTVQGDVTDITEQFDDLVETNPRFGADVATQPEEKNIYQELLESSTNSVLEALGKAPEKAKTIEEYKQIFSDATGIDVSGQPDNSAALTAFGLALMQNKAGKGFNVGRILSETGRAGEVALPLMVQAKKDARASQLAAGQFALTQQGKDKAARTAFINDQVTYLRDRRDTINDKMVDRINAVDDIVLKQKLKNDAAYTKYLYDRQIKLLQLDDKRAKGKFKTTDKVTFKPIMGMNNITLTMGVRESDGQPVFRFPVQEAKRFGVALADVNDGLRSLDDISELITIVSKQPGGITGQAAIEELNKWSKTIGFDSIYVNPNTKDLSTTPLADAAAIQKRVVAQYKRFLSQETGNGISEGDVQRLDDSLGVINFVTDPDVALRRIEETRKIFMGRKRQIVSEIEGFQDRSQYLTDEAYDKTTSQLLEDINKAYYYDKDGKSGDRNNMLSEVFNVSVGDDGIPTYSLKAAS